MRANSFDTYERKQLSSALPVAERIPFHLLMDYPTEEELAEYQGLCEFSL